MCVPVDDGERVLTRRALLVRQQEPIERLGIIRDAGDFARVHREERRGDGTSISARPEPRDDRNVTKLERRFAARTIRTRRHSDARRSYGRCLEHFVAKQPILPEDEARLLRAHGDPVLEQRRGREQVSEISSGVELKPHLPRERGFAARLHDLLHHRAPMGRFPSRRWGGSSPSSNGAPSTLWQRPQCASGALGAPASNTPVLPCQESRRPETRGFRSARGPPPRSTSDSRSANADPP